MMHRGVRASSACVAAAVLVSACGGGGGGGSQPAPTPPAPPPPTYTVGGTVTGLAGTGLVLRNNGGNDLAVSANGTFTFTTALTTGGAYAVSVHTQPASPTQACTVASGGGSVSANVTNVAVTCVTNTYRVGGTVTGLVGTGLVLRNGGENLAIAANGAFTFATPVASGASYAVVVHTNPTGPTQTCAVSSAGGNVGSSDVTNVAIKCGYSVGGTVTGLQGTGLVLRNNGGDSLSITASGAFSFSTLLDNGATYDVTTFTHPLNRDQECTTTRGTGTIAGADVTDVAVNCYVMGRWLYVGNGITGGLTGLKINQTSGMLDAGMPVGPSATPDRRFLYLGDGNTSSIIGYSVNPTNGSLTFVPNSPFVGGRSPVDRPAMTPDGKFLYSTDQTQPRLFGHAIHNTTGELTNIPGSPFTTAAGTIYARVDPTGRFLYVVTRSMAPVVDAISLSAYSIDATTGALTPVPGTPIAVGTSMPIDAGMELSADGTALFILPSPQPPSIVYGYTLDATTGLPVPMQGSPFTLPGTAFHLRPHPRLPVLYVGGSNFVAAYRIGTTLTALTGSPYAMTGGPVETAFDPGARFLYALTSNDGITSFEVDDDGALEAMINGTLATGQAHKMLADPGGRYLFVSDFIPGNIRPIAIDTRTGRLSLVPGGTIAGGNGTVLLTIVK